MAHTCARYADLKKKKSTQQGVAGACTGTEEDLPQRQQQDAQREQRDQDRSKSPGPPVRESLRVIANGSIVNVGASSEDNPCHEGRPALDRVRTNLSPGTPPQEQCSFGSGLLSLSDSSPSPVLFRAPRVCPQGAPEAAACRGVGGSLAADGFHHVSDDVSGRGRESSGDAVAVGGGRSCFQRRQLAQDLGPTAICPPSTFNSGTPFTFTPQARTIFLRNEASSVSPMVQPLLPLTPQLDRSLEEKLLELSILSLDGTARQGRELSTSQSLLGMDLFGSSQDATEKGRTEEDKENVGTGKKNGADVLKEEPTNARDISFHEAYRRALSLTELKTKSTREAFDWARDVALENQAQIVSEWKGLVSRLQRANEGMVTENSMITSRYMETRLERDALRREVEASQKPSSTTCLPEESLGASSGGIAEHMNETTHAPEDSPASSRPRETSAGKEESIESPSAVRLADHQRSAAASKSSLAGIAAGGPVAVIAATVSRSSTTTGNRLRKLAFAESSCEARSAASPSPALPETPAGVFAPTPASKILKWDSASTPAHESPITAKTFAPSPKGVAVGIASVPELHRAELPRVTPPAIPATTGGAASSIRASPKSNGKSFPDVREPTSSGIPASLAGAGRRPLIPLAQASREKNGDSTELEDVSRAATGASPAQVTIGTPSFVRRDSAIPAPVHTPVEVFHNNGAATPRGESLRSATRLCAPPDLACPPVLRNTDRNPRDGSGRRESGAKSSASTSMRPRFSTSMTSSPVLSASAPSKPRFSTSVNRSPPSGRSGVGAAPVEHEGMRRAGLRKVDGNVRQEAKLGQSSGGRRGGSIASEMMGGDPDRLQDPPQKSVAIKRMVHKNDTVPGAKAAKAGMAGRLRSSSRPRVHPKDVTGGEQKIVAGRGLESSGRREALSKKSTRAPLKRKTPATAKRRWL